MVAGDQLPLIPFEETEGKLKTFPPWQTDAPPPKLKVVATIGFTVTVKVAVSPHCPASGVNVYVAEFWLSATAGLQLPDIPFEEVVGRTGTAPPVQIERLVPKLNEGARFGVTDTV